MDSNPRKVNHDEIPAPKPPEGWTPPPDPTPEELRKEALARLAKIDQCRAIEALIRDGWDDERIAANQGIDIRTVRVVRQRMESEETSCPVTPKELGWRRAAGHMSDQEMMDRLRSWPYTFSRVVFDAIDYGDWDDVVWLREKGYISREEFGELKAITDPMPKRPDVL